MAFFGGQADQHDQADLGVRRCFLAPQEEGAEGAGHGDGVPQEDADTGATSFVLAARSGRRTAAEKAKMTAGRALLRLLLRNDHPEVVEPHLPRHGPGEDSSSASCLGRADPGAAEALIWRTGQLYRMVNSGPAMLRADLSAEGDPSASLLRT